jgi:hypothetical protein
VITTPSDGSSVTGVTMVEANATDAQGVAAVQFELDGIFLGPLLTASPWETAWDTMPVPDGLHVLIAFAWDSQLNRGMSQPVIVTVDHSAAPGVTFSTFLGGSDHESIRDVFVDARGYIYATGGTASNDFPTTAGALDRTFNGTHDIYVAEFTPDGGTLVASTYFGGPNYDRAYAIEVDDQGYVYLAGRAGDGFPTTPGSLQPTFGGDDNPDPVYGAQDGFVAKLTPDLSQVVWATYFGNDSGNALRDIAIDAAGNCYVVGGTDRPHYAVTPGSFDDVYDGVTDGIVAEIAADGASVVWGSYFGGSFADGGTPSIRVAADGTAWVLGHSQSDDFPVTANAYQKTRGGDVDIVVFKVAPGGSKLDWATYFGGTDAEFSETHGLSVDSAGIVTVAASTLSPDLPFVPASIPPPFQPKYGGSGGKNSGAGTNYPGDGFVAKFSADGSSLVAFTYYGGSRGEGVEGVAVDDQGRVNFTGGTYSSDLPMTATSLQPDKAGGADAFFARFSSDLTTLEFATYGGGKGDDLGRALAIGIDGRLVAAGTTASDDFPTSPLAFQPDPIGASETGFVYELVP